MRILETELLGVAASAAPGAVELLKALDPMARRKAGARVGQAFDILSSLDYVSVAETEIEGSGQFDSVLYGKRTGGTIVAYSFSGLASDLVVPLFSAAIAFFTRSLGPGSAGDAANAVIAFWKNLSVLRLPEDADAIDVIRAAVSVRMQLSSYTADHLPSTAEIAQTSSLDEAKVVAALRTLLSRRILSVDQWGGQRDDVADPANRWTFEI
jgi:hypothetical protein